ncbi:MAG: hypothetical protein IMF04_03440, partial [Proteobacteria bacterium]|nr:hypothetical protein [Pseudomonadota bacterium]
MKGLAKIGSKPVAIVTLIISCLVVAAGFTWLQQSFSGQGQGQQNLEQQQIATMIHKSISSRIDLLSQQMASVATSPDLARLIMSGDSEAISAKQTLFASLFPSAQKVCLFSADVDQPDENACLPITFASLNSLRLAKENGSAPMALMQAGKDNAHLLLAHRIMDSAEQVAGVLVVALNPDVVKNLLIKEYGGNGYVELRQGVKKTSVVAKQGNGQWKQGAAIFDKKIANSHWRISYWSAKSAESSSLFMMILGAMLGVMVVMWLLREFWQSTLLKRDVAILQQQIGDIKENKSKSQYPLSNTKLQELTSDLRALAIDMVAPPLGSPLKENIKPKPQPEPMLQAEEPEAEMEQKVPTQPDPIIPPTDVQIEPALAPAVEEVIIEESSELTFAETSASLDVVEPVPEPQPVVDEAPLEFNILEPTPVPKAESKPEVEPKKPEPANVAVDAPLELKVAEPEIQEEATLELNIGEPLSLELPSLQDEQSDDVDPSIFKAYDIRGIVGQTLNENTVRKIGQAIGSEAKEQGQTRLVIGHDGRHSSPSLTTALIEGILASGCDAVDIGMVPTPVLYFACHHLGTHSGVMVTGSHNPADYNGLKITLNEKSLAGDELQALYQRIEQDNLSTGQGKKNNANVIDDYIAKIVGDIKVPRSVKLVIDSG